MAPTMEQLAAMLRAKFAEGPQAAPAWVLVCFYVLMISFVYRQISIVYGHGSVVATLAMVEDTSPTAVIHETSPLVYSDEPDAKPPAYREEAVTLVTLKPITSSNKRTIRHLMTVDGGRSFSSPFRGFGVALLHGLLTHWIANGVFWLVGGKSGATLGFLVSQVALFRLNMLWTHMVISKKSSKWFYQRVVPRRIAKKAILPTMAWAGVHVAISWVLIQLIDVLRFEKHMHHNGNDPKMHCAMAKVAFLAVVSLALLLFVYLPANVALTRIQASLLSEEEEPVIPFDRTFGGRTQVEGPRWRMIDAWRSFDWNARVRLLKVYLRTILYQIILTFVFATVGFIIVAAWLMIDGKEGNVGDGVGAQ